MLLFYRQFKCLFLYVRIYISLPASLCVCVYLYRSVSVLLFALIFTLLVCFAGICHVTLMKEERILRQS